MLPVRNDGAGESDAVARNNASQSPLLRDRFDSRKEKPRRGCTTRGSSGPLRGPVTREENLATFRGLTPYTLESIVRRASAAPGLFFLVSRLGTSFVRISSMKEKTVYVNQWQGKDVNDGLSEDTPVLSKKRALEIQRKKKTQALKIVGTADFNRRFLSDTF